MGGEQISGVKQEYQILFDFYIGLYIYIHTYTHIDIIVNLSRVPVVPLNAIIKWKKTLLANVPECSYQNSFIIVSRTNSTSF